MNIIVLCGVNGSGKTTYYKDYLKKHKGTLGYSFDDINHIICGHTYWTKHSCNYLYNLFKVLLKYCAQNNIDLIIDNLNQNNYFKEDIRKYYKNKLMIYKKIYNIDITIKYVILYQPYTYLKSINNIRKYTDKDRYTDESILLNYYNILNYFIEQHKLKLDSKDKEQILYLDVEL